MPVDQPRSPASAWIMLFLLFLAYNLSLLDRMILSLLVEPIKQSLSISDTQVSLLQGLAFLVMYSLAGLPIGLLVDRLKRTRLLAAGVAAWSIMTVACGLAGSFGMLFLARVGVGIGEATLSPGAYSLIANTFPKTRLALALGLYSIGGATGAGLALIVGGGVYAALTQAGGLALPGLGPIEPWRATFIAVGLPGLLVALLIGRLREPAREATGGAAFKSAGRAEIAAFYRANYRVVVPLHLAVGCSNMALLGVVSWIAPFFMRVHGWEIGQVGLVGGGLNIVAGVIGLLAGGALSDLLVRYGSSTRLLLCAAVAPVGATASVVFALAPGSALSAGFLGVFLTCAILPFNVANAAFQAIVPANMRGFASAVLLLVVSLLSAAGPTFLALMSDNLFTATDGIRYSMAIFGASALAMSGTAFLFAIGPYARSTAPRPARGRGLTLREAA